MTFDQLAEALLLARRKAIGAASLPSPESLDEAYAVQDKIASALGEVGGWKVGAGTPADEPLFAPMPRSWMTSGTPLNSRLRGVEVEIAFLIGRDLPAHKKPYSREEVLAAIASAHPAIEIIESGLADPNTVPRFLKIADLQIHGGFVAGSAIPDWQQLDWSQETATLRMNGTVQTQRTGSNAAGDLLRLVIYLANQGSARTGGLRAGQWVTTGSWTGVAFCQPQDVAEGQFTHSEAVRVTFG